ncbi:phosphate acyltransferase [Eubacteriaceae bacterium ES2]|nr:phosphate acyltransferase [Eubacteriaceae bacterium ES2]
MNFSDIEKLVENGQKPFLAIAVSEETRLLKAVDKALGKSLSGAYLIGDGQKIKELKNRFNLELFGAEIISAESPEAACEMAVLLANQGKADLVMKGLVDTAVFLKAVIQKEKGLMTGQLLSSVMVVELPAYHKPIITTDGGWSLPRI